MDDPTISSASFEKHVQHVKMVLEEASKVGFEFKLTKGQFNQPEVEVWGCICDKTGRRPKPKQVDQMKLSLIHI